MRRAVGLLSEPPVTKAGLLQKKREQLRQTVDVQREKERKHMIYTAEELFKLRLPADADLSNDEVGALLLRAGNTILDITGRTEIPSQLLDVQAELALIYYNRKGTEGEKKRAEGEITMDFTAGIPEDIIMRLKNYPRKVGVLSAAD